MKNFKNVENFNMNKFGFKTAKTKKFTVVSYEEDADGINYSEDEAEIDGYEDNSVGSGDAKSFDSKEDAEKFIEADANQYKKDYEKDDADCEVELLALPNDMYVAVGTTSFCKFWKIVEIFDIKHEQSERKNQKKIDLQQSIFFLYYKHKEEVIMEDITWKEILFVIILMIVGGYMSYNATENYQEVVAAVKVINAQNQNK